MLDDTRDIHEGYTGEKSCQMRLKTLWFVLKTVDTKLDINAIYVFHFLKKLSCRKF